MTCSFHFLATFKCSLYSCVTTDLQLVVFWRNRLLLPLSYAILAKGHGCAGHSLPPSHARGVAAQTLSLVRGPAAVVGRPCDVQGSGDPPQARSAKEKSYCSLGLSLLSLVLPSVICLYPIRGLFVAFL